MFEESILQAVENILVVAIHNFTSLDSKLVTPCLVCGPLLMEKACLCFI
jgi:hypothetical protein